MRGGGMGWGGIGAIWGGRGKGIGVMGGWRGYREKFVKKYNIR